MSKGAVQLNENNVEYYTPKSVVDMFGKFDYDPATTNELAELFGVNAWDTIETDGLTSDWRGFARIWCNPPFNRKHEFWEKACESYAKAQNDIKFLCPIEFLTTKRFHASLAKYGLGVKIYIPSGRIKFKSGVGANEKSPAFGSVIISPSDCMGLKLFEL